MTVLPTKTGNFSDQKTCCFNIIIDLSLHSFLAENHLFLLVKKTIFSVLFYSFFLFFSYSFLCQCHMTWLIVRPHRGRCFFIGEAIVTGHVTHHMMYAR